MAIVTGGLGQPEEGALVAGGLGAGVAAPTGTIYALLTGSGSVVGGVVALGHLAASLAGAGDIYDAELLDGSGGVTHTYGSVIGVSTSTGHAHGRKHSFGGVAGQSVSSGHAGIPPAPTGPPAILPPLFGISLDPAVLHRKRRTRGAVVGASVSSGAVRGVSRRSSAVSGATVSTGEARGYSRLVSDDDEVMLLLGYLTPVG